RLDAEEPRREGDRLPVVSRRGGDQASPAILLAELRDEVDAAAHLEGADRLVVLVLHPDLGADERVERGVAVERGRNQVRSDAPSGGEHVDERRRLEGHGATVPPLRLERNRGASGGSGGGR